ncbi:DNA repair endonuclease UVH1 [Magnolia sinica]|uniref:DNA repair endonuclease UVH1 n=1 Tax=Magnolia sinica TaxID=86752 RepID=UPI00265A008B|nr:DNA repair endonuclease UVH1 [Magnolia sinica]
MLRFHEHIISDLLEDPNGGLVILSSGLSLHRMISSLLHLHTPSQGTLLILSASPSQRSAITRSLLSQNPDPNPNPNLSTAPIEISFDLPAHQRLSLYSSGAILFITSRILAVDLLTSKLPPSRLAGLIILNAHSLSDTSTEALAVRILRSHNPSAYVRAFSDRPHAMAAGFAKAERTMKCLFVRKLHLWPRFHVFVSEDLEQSPPSVVDVRVPLSPLMKGIQKAVIEAMDACLKELRKTNKVDVEDLTVENGLFKSFDEIVRRQLDPIWHTIGRKTKQLVADLRTLRKLLDYLVRYDAVTYLKYLDALRVSEGVRSVWIFAESSHKIFEYAKKRVYRLVTSEGGKLHVDGKSGASKKRRVKEDSKTEKEVTGGASLSNGNGDVEANTNSGVVLEEVLEEAPKWKVLREILGEIEEERQKQAQSSEGELTVEDAGDDSGIVLIACKDERSCMQLEDCIMKGPEKVMREEWGKYLLGKAQLHGLQTRNKKKSRDPKGFGILNGVVSPAAGENAEASSVSKLEHDVLMAAASEIRNLANEEILTEDDSKPDAGRGGRGRGRGKGRSRKASVEVKISGSKVIGKMAKNGKSERSGLENSELENKGWKGSTDSTDIADFQENLQASASMDKGVLRKHSQEADTSELTHAKPLPPVQFYALESDRHILDVMKPLAIVVYHPDMTFVREIEIYKAENPSRKVKVYFLFYEHSTEVQKFEASIRRENGAFESLIRQKSLMTIPVDQDGRCSGLTISSESQSLISQNSITRKAGGRKAPEKEMQVIVDMREFMSSLPNVLHLKGMRIIPVTLEVGDYVLSPLICVERKSISDLFSSFTSGRLYHQVETMVRYYRIPVLLIEFSQDRSFSFQSASDIGDDVMPTNIISKLSLLVLHFPRLRLVWSRSLHATAEIFASLKANQDEPDEGKAMRVGVPTNEGIVEDDVRAENYNTSAVEFLRRLPGVTDSNYRALMDGCQSLAELALLPVERLAELMGSQKAAGTLRDFLDAKCPTMV